MVLQPAVSKTAAAAAIAIPVKVVVVFMRFSL